MGESLLVGADIGAGLLKIVEGRRKWMAPNVIDRRMNGTLKEGHGLSPDDWLDIEITTSPLSSKPIRFFFGSIAVEKGATERKLKMDKLIEEDTALGFMAGLLRTAASRLGQMSREERAAYFCGVAGRYVVPFCVGTGAPIHQFENRPAWELFTSRIKPKFVGRFVTTPRYQDLGPIEIRVEKVRTTQEAVAAVIDRRLDEHGQVRWRGNGKSWIAVFDQGASTLDWAVMDENEKLLPLLSDGMDNGLAAQWQALTDHINRIRKSSFTRSQLIKVLHENNFCVPQGNELISLAEIADEYLGTVGKEVANKVLDVWENSHRQIGLVLFVGGGAESLQRYLRPIFDGVRGVKVEFAPDALFANASGYYKRLVHTLEREKAAKPNA